MKFSVLMSVYNEENEKYLTEALESVINQTLKPDQIVIVKDGKLNQILEAVIDNYSTKYHKLIKVYEYEKNKGLGYALQKGIMQCDYDYIARMDSDDIAVDNRFEIQMNYIKDNPNIDVLGGYLEEYDEELKTKISIRKVPLNNQEIYANIGKQCPFNHSTVIFKKEAVINSKNYKAEPIEDYRLWIEMCVKNCKLANMPEVMIKYRTSPQMYKRRTGLKYWYKIKEVEELLLKYKFISKYQYIKNLFCRWIVAIIPYKLKRYVYPKIIRKYEGNI